jgi:membrane-associated PAP2 superfamily phosphatase
MTGPRLSDRVVLAGIPAAGALLLLSLEATDVDRVIGRWFFDAAAGAFPWRYDAFLEVVLHQWGKYLVVLIGCLVAGGLLLSYVVQALAPHRRLLLYLVLALSLAPATVTAIKSVSNKYCPWDLAEFGGFLPYTRLLDAPPPAVKAGRCFPAGHASAGFALLAFYFAGRATGNRTLARAGLAAGLGMGLILGLGRMLQGAHFLSHTLWSGLICWTVMAALYAAILRPRRDRSAADARQT